MKSKHQNPEAFWVEKTCKICSDSFESGMNDPDQGCCVDCRHFLNQIMEHPSGPSIKATLFRKLNEIKDGYQKRINNAHATPYDYVSGPLKLEIEALKKQIEQLRDESGSLSMENARLKWGRIMDDVWRQALESRIGTLEGDVYQSVVLDEWKLRKFFSSLMSALQIRSSENNPYAAELYNYFVNNEAWLRQLLLGYTQR